MKVRPSVALCVVIITAERHEPWARAALRYISRQNHGLSSVPALQLDRLLGSKSWAATAENYSASVSKLVFSGPVR